MYTYNTIVAQALVRTKNMLSNEKKIGSYYESTHSKFKA